MTRNFHRFVAEHLIESRIDPMVVVVKKVVGASAAAAEGAGLPARLRRKAEWDRLRLLRTLHIGTVHVAVAFFTLFLSFFAWNKKERHEQILGILRDGQDRGCSLLSPESCQEQISDFTCCQVLLIKTIKIKNIFLHLCRRQKWNLVNW